MARAILWVAHCGALSLALGCGQAEGASSGLGGDSGATAASGGAGAAAGGASSAAGGAGAAAGRSGAVGAGGVSTAAGVGGAEAGQGSGGKTTQPPLTDSEFCDEQCAATSMHYVFPAAFCEDWRYPSLDRVASYCDPLVVGADCSSGCVQELSQTTESCHVALRAAIPCAAKVYARGPVLTPSCLFAECARLMGTVSVECNGFREELAGARARWESSGSDDYTFRWDKWTVVVTAGVPAVVEGGFSGNAPTIPALFERVEHWLTDGVAPKIVYDAVLGYPRSASFALPCGDVVDTFGVADLSLR